MQLHVLRTMVAKGGIGFRDVLTILIFPTLACEFLWRFLSLRSLAVLRGLGPQHLVGLSERGAMAGLERSIWNLDVPTVAARLGLLSEE
jgi:hypothetical protein